MPRRSDAREAQELGNAEDALPVTALWRNTVLAIVLGVESVAICTANAQCVSDTIGVPVRMANGVSWNSFGSAQGEVFFAVDTLIESVTVWRPANYGPIALGLNLFITKAALPARPILVDGGVVRVYDSDPPGLPVPMTWTFDPPVSLPGKGDYVLWFQVENCNPLDYPILYHGGSDEYPIGGCVYTMRTLGGPCVHMPNVLGGCPPDVDMCFQVVSCHDAATPAKRKSWGLLKMLYR